MFTLDYELGRPVKVAVNIFDEVRKGENKGMGSAVFDIGELLGARGNTKARKLKKGGTIFCAVRKSKGSGMLRLQLKGNKLKNVEGLLSKSDPFFELSRKVDAAGSLTWDNVYRSKDVHNNLNPQWDTAVIDLSVLCAGDMSCPILVSVFDHESSGKHKPMGSFETTVDGFVEAANSKDPLQLLKKGKKVGSITVTRAEITGVEQDISQRMAATSISPAIAATPMAPLAAAPIGQANFIDYVTGGCDLNVCVAIDFTGSNGDPRKPGTLHHIHQDGSLNDYEKAINSIVSILAKYDSDQKFPVLGFGAKYGGVVRHCFQCGPTEEVHGVDGVLNAYRMVFKSGLVMSGPTVFDEVFQTAAAKAISSQEEAKRKGQQAYTILLVLTDGAVSDIQRTAQTLGSIADAPLSVIIVGVGGADFSAMQFLDDHSNPPGKRDIAQFVQFNKHCHDSVALTSETLHEVPDQLTSYFRSHSIAPLPPLQRSDSKVEVMPEEDEIDLTLDIGEDEIVVTGGGDGFVDGFARY